MTSDKSYNDQFCSHFASSTGDKYIESRELRGEGRWYVAHSFIDADTSDVYEVWVDKYGDTTVVEPMTLYKMLQAKGYKV